MSAINAYPIDLSQVKKLDLPAGAIRKLSDEEIAQFKAIMEMAKNPPKIDPMQADNHPSKLYAEIVKDGQVIAKVYKSGCAETSNAIGARLRSFFETTDDRDQRAEAIAKAAGGTIRYTGRYTGKA